MQEEKLKDFVLVGGTALALQVGHRVSIDIDLFGRSNLDQDDILDTLYSYGTIQLIKKSENILILSLNGIKVDVVNYRYPWIGNIDTVQNIRFASLSDIAAMKLNAIAGRGSVKDFIDLYVLLEQFTLREMLNFYNEKYQDGSEFMVIKSLTFFDDAENEELPHLFIHTSWAEIKQQILAEIDRL
jgi:predicted nucleotidyltransferase component of viral defense system